MHLLQNLLSALQHGQLPEFGIWTYGVLALLVAVEGPLATLLGASAASAGLMRPGYVFLAAVGGNLTADLLWYTVGYLGRIEWLFRFGKRLGMRRDLLERLRENLLEHAVKVLFLAKLTVSLVIPSLITAGLLRLPLRRWFLPFLAAETLWTGALVLIGYSTVQALTRVERGIETVVLFGSILFVATLVVAGHRIVKNWMQEQDETERR
jgi:membrane protein DedA with SNARE-associated domain